MAVRLNMLAQTMYAGKKLAIEYTRVDTGALWGAALMYDYTGKIEDAIKEKVTGKGYRFVTPVEWSKKKRGYTATVEW